MAFFAFNTAEGFVNCNPFKVGGAIKNGKDFANLYRMAGMEMVPARRGRGGHLFQA